MFICKSNSARSIAAECIARHRADPSCGLLFYSAGTNQGAEIKDPVRCALARAGYPLEGIRSKSLLDLLQQLADTRIDYIITMCCEAQSELQANMSIRAALQQSAPCGTQILHLPFEVSAPTDSCRRQGLTGCEPEASVHYDAMVQTIESFVQPLPADLAQARPLVL